MKRKERIFLLSLLLMMVLIGTTVSAYAAEDSMHEICGSCGDGFITYYCAGDAYIWDTSTHTKNGVTCTIKGYKCQTRSSCDSCNRDVYEGTHYCYEIHSACGLGVYDYCTLLTAVTEPGDGYLDCGDEHEH